MMDFITLVADSAPQLTNIIGKFINILHQAVGGSFGWTVIVFTLILQVIMSPLDIWQKFAQRKQSRSMMVMQPKLNKIQQQYANNPEMLKQKQAELYREAKMGPGSMIGMCLPMIISMVIFFVVFSGFNAVVRYQNELIVYKVAQAYAASGFTLTPDQLAAFYTPEKWLWVENIFRPDTWTTVIPSLDQFVGTGLGQIGSTLPDVINWQGGYDTIIGPAADLFNKQSFWQISKWNGYFILPLLTIVFSIFSSKVMQATTSQMPQSGDPDKQKANKMSQKMMLIIMPLMMAVFSMFYSAAFCIYMICRSIFTTAFGVSFNLVTKKQNKAFEEQLLENTFRR